MVYDLVFRILGLGPGRVLVFCLSRVSRIKRLGPSRPSASCKPHLSSTANRQAQALEPNLIP
jgi:hypothetical protein